jgi:hypothetical protein
MLGFNGGLMGVQRTPTTGTASGLWFQNEQSVAKRAGIWPVISSDEYWANVVLLLRCDGSNGSSTFTDLSNSNHSITVTGATVSTAEKQFGTGSLRVDNNQYITTPGSSDFSLPGDFTVEMWAKFDTSQASADKTLFELGAYDNGILLRSDGVYFNGGLYDSTIGLVNTSWRHYAVTRSGTTVRLFYAGVSQTLDSSTVSGTLNTANAAVRFGATRHSGADGTNYMQGYIDEIRITKGVARYTANFTPPTAAFPNG